MDSQTRISILVTLFFRSYSNGVRGLSPTDSKIHPTERVRGVRSREEILTNVDVDCMVSALSDTVAQFCSLTQGPELATRVLTGHSYTYKRQRGVYNCVARYKH